MRIPADAQIDDRKLDDYLLVPLARDDKSGYLALAGFDRSNAGLLRSAIIALCDAAEAVPAGTTQYGTKWVVSGTIRGPNGRDLAVRVVWIERLDGTFHAGPRSRSDAMRPEPFDEVEVLRDDAGQHVRAGQRGRLLDRVPGPPGSEEGAVAELHYAADRADPVVIVPRSWVRAVAATGAETQAPPTRKRAV
jgi:hypothetical protein